VRYILTLVLAVSITNGSHRVDLNFSAQNETVISENLSEVDFSRLQ